MQGTKFCKAILRHKITKCYLHQKQLKNQNKDKQICLIGHIAMPPDFI